jgi:hypothetical protein
MKRRRRDRIGGIVIVTGILVALYVALGWCLIGGVIDVIHQVRADVLSVGATAWGVVKIFFSFPIGLLAGCVFAVPGVLLRRGANNQAQEAGIDIGR